jgi:hypothetical protein
LGAFASLEECGVTCAAAGHCELLSFFIDAEWAPFPQSCDERPYECPGMAIQRYERVPAECAVWGVFHVRGVSSADLPFPGQWEVLNSLSLAPDVLGLVICGPR